MELPTFRYHPDPLLSGSIEPSNAKCRCCGQARGYIYTGPVYSEEELDEALCPWCIADGSAHEKFDTSFFDEHELPDGASPESLETIAHRTPGFNMWQSVSWPACCGEPMAFIEPAGIDEIRKKYYTLEGTLMMHIVHDMSISGGAATRLLNSLHREKGPTAYVFRCTKCECYNGRIDEP